MPGPRWSWRLHIRRHEQHSSLDTDASNAAARSAHPCFNTKSNCLLHEQPQHQNAAPHGKEHNFHIVFGSPALIRWQLTKDDEASAQSEDLEVRREDQEKINRFSSLHQKEEILEEELRAKIVRPSYFLWIFP